MSEKMTNEEFLSVQKRERSINISVAFIISLPVSIICSLVYNVFIASKFSIFQFLSCMFISIAVISALGMIFQIHKAAQSICAHFGFNTKTIQGLISKSAFVGIVLGLICTICNVAVTISADKKYETETNWKIVQEEYQPQLAEIENDIWILENKYAYDTNGSLMDTESNRNITEQINAKDTAAQKLYDKIDKLEKDVPSFGSRFRFSVVFMIIAGIVGSFVIIPFADKVEACFRSNSEKEVKT